MGGSRQELAAHHDIRAQNMISTIQRVNDLARSAEPTRLPSILVSELPTRLGRHHNAFNCVWGVVVWGVTNATKSGPHQRLLPV